MDITKHFIIFAVAVTLAVFQLSRLPKADVKTSFPFDRQVGNSAGHDLQEGAGFLSDDAAEDWHNLVNAAASRFMKHGSSVEFIDGRSEGGRGYRRLIIHASPPRWRACEDRGQDAYSCLVPADEEQDEDAAVSASPPLAFPVLLATAVEAAGRHTAAHAVQVGQGGPGKAAASRHFFSPRKKPVPPRPHMPPPGATRPPTGSKRSSTWRSWTSWLGGGAGAMGGSSLDRQAAGGRGKAARAFGAGQRGPGLINRAARSKSVGDPPSLTLYLHAHIAGITCCHGDGGGEGGQQGYGLQAPVLYTTMNTTTLLSLLQSSSGGSSLAMGGSGGGAGRLDAVGALVGLLRDVRRLHIATVVSVEGNELTDAALGLVREGRPAVTRPVPPAPPPLDPQPTGTPDLRHELGHEQEEL